MPSRPDDTPQAKPLIELGSQPFTVAQVEQIALGEARVELSETPSVLRALQRGTDLLEAALKSEQAVYGVKTGVGDSCETNIESAAIEQMPANLFRFHGCGTGRLFSPVEGAAILVARICSLVSGASAVRPLILTRTTALLNQRAIPCIPSEGSVGASGDLTPLSYLAAVLAGEREVYDRHGNVRATCDVVTELPLTLRPKESLALMNGTSAMTGLACLAYQRARRLARLAAALSAVGSDVMEGQQCHFNDKLFALKPHPGQRACARWVREDLGLAGAAVTPDKRLQDRYSLRCAPHVIGVLLDNLVPIGKTIEIELNSVNDNPVFDLDSGEVLHGGNFYGGHICQAMDTLKTCVANIADLLDRQLVLLCHPDTNGGLPTNLVAKQAGPTHHGFKAMQISTSALAAEALKLTIPASIFSRSTENHNQDKVSMGTIAARDCLRILELTEQVAVILLLALCQAVDLRGPETRRPRAQALHESVRAFVDFNSADRRMDVDISQVLHLYRTRKLPVGPIDFPEPA